MIRGSVFPRLGRDAEIGTQERGPEFCDQIFEGVGVIPDLAAPAQPGFASC